MTAIKKILLAILSILLVIDLNLIVLTISANETILNPKFVEYELDKFDAYPRIKETIISNFKGDETFTRLINDSITENWIRSQSHALIHNFFSYVKSDSERINLAISVLGVKKNLLNNIQTDVTISMYAGYMENEISKIPDEIDLYEYLDSNAITTLKNMQKAVNYFYFLSYLLIAVAVVIPIISMVITRNLKSIIRFIGNSLFMGGLISYGTGVLAVNMTSQKFRSGEMPNTIPEDIILGVLQDVMEPVKTYGVILLVPGVILLILSFFIKEKGKKKNSGERT